MRSGLKTSLAASIKGKAAAAVLAAMPATGSVAGAGVAANQGAFGQQVMAQVAACKAHLAQGVHGIDACVSDFAQQHGTQERQQHRQGTPAPTAIPAAMVVHPAGRRVPAMARGTANPSRRPGALSGDP